MAEYSANAVQTINPGESAIFTATVIPCDLGLIQHLDETPSFSLSGWVPNNNRCCCNRQRAAEYEAHIGCNIAIATGGTPGQIAVAFAIDGSTFAISEMDSNPAAVEEYFHVSNQLMVPILRGCCQTLTVRNISDQPILMKNLILSLNRPDLN